MNVLANLVVTADLVFFYTVNMYIRLGYFN